MANDKKNVKQGESLVEIESALTRSEQFIEKNRKMISIAAVVIILAVAIFLGAKKFYFQPREKEALSQMFVAEQYFEKDSYSLALNGDGNYLGFLDIIDQYKFTDAANLAHYYAGISFLHLGKFQEALDQLKKFKTSELNLKAVATGAQGDANVELGNKDKAVSLYEKAASFENEFTSPIYLMKLGILYEDMNQLDKALETYESIKTKFPASAEARNVEKYIARVNVKK
ncbi:MAG: tetratricopeptide repeat protein [Bacteroidota bacterium]|nr:tetratricopeptide repeat protein [Bacteroidota bacterium]